MKKIIFSFICLLFFSIGAHANNQCFNMIPEIESHFNGLRAIPGKISGQILIDKEAKGLSRFTSKKDVYVMDAERVIFMGMKEILPMFSVVGLKFEGVHVAGLTNKPYHRGIEIFSMDLATGSQDESEIIFDFLVDPFLPFYLKNFNLETTPLTHQRLKGRFWLLGHSEDRTQKWSHHTFLYSSKMAMTGHEVLNLYFKTSFDNTYEGSQFLNWLEHNTSGPRIDTCVYFLVSQ